MKTTKIASTVILLCVPVLIYACATAKSQYEDARKIGTISAYQEFLIQYPSGEYAERAQNSIEALNFEKAQAVNSVDAYESFMLSSKSDLFKTYAIQRIQKIYKDEYLKAKAIDSIEAYSDYITRYPKSDYLPKSLERIDYLEWIATLKRHDAVAYYKYLYNCSACGEHDQEARHQLARALRSGKRTDLSVVKTNVEQILKRSDIVTLQSKSNKTVTKTGSMLLKDLASADEVLVSIMKAGKTISAADLEQGNYASEKKLRLKNRVPLNSDNTIGFSTVIFYSQKNGVTALFFIEDGRGYMFKETDMDIY